MAINFKVIQGTNIEEFQRQVQEKLDEGWQLHGNMIAVPDSNEVNSGILYIQALIKEGQERRKTGFSIGV